jgi:hypothetical protein
VCRYVAFFIGSVVVLAWSVLYSLYLKLRPDKGARVSVFYVLTDGRRDLVGEQVATPRPMVGDSYKLRLVLKDSTTKETIGSPAWIQVQPIPRHLPQSK